MRVSASGYFTFALFGFIASFMVLPSSKAVNNFFFVFVAIPALAMILAGKAPRPRITWLAGLWCAFFLWAAVRGAAEHGQFYKHLVYTAIFCLAVWLWADERRFALFGLIRVYFWTLIAYVAGSTLYFWFGGSYEPGERVYLLPSRLEGPILTSMLIVSCFAWLLPEWLRRDRWLEIALGLAGILFCVGFVLQSRSGLVGLAACCAVVYLTMLRRWRWSLRLGSLVLVVLIVVGGFWLLLQRSEVAESLVARADAGRFIVWKGVLDHWLNCGLWTGCGPQFFPDIRLKSGLQIEHAHNIFLALGFRFGLPGLILFLLLMTSTLWQAWKQSSPWGWYLLTALFMLNFDGRDLINSPHEVWLLVLLPSMLILAQQRIYFEGSGAGRGGEVSGQVSDYLKDSKYP